VFAKALDYAEQGVMPGRTADVIAWAVEFSAWEADADRELWMNVLCDPQTSGGLLIACAEADADQLADELTLRDVLCARIGRCVAGEPGRVIVG
jgi:selenide,water dikinase